MGTDKKT